MTAPARAELELGDLQGGILSAYGKMGFPKARFLLFQVRDGAAGRRFVETLRPRVTTALRWPSSKGISTGKVEVPRPDCTLNLAFTFWGLLALDVPTRTLRGLPDEFIDGMAVRAPVLGDDLLLNRPAYWDPVWRPEAPKAHILVMLNGSADHDGICHPALEALTADVLAAAPPGVILLEGHAGADPRFQDLSALYAPGPDGRPRAQPTEHFGFVDAIGDPVFEGQYPGREEEKRCVGQGAVDGEGRWRPLATGEFVLGWPDEAQEVAGAAMPLDFSRNGSFFAYRKLHQHLETWDDWIATRSAELAVHWGIADPADAALLLKAKMAGRWPDGVPLSLAPTLADWRAFQARYPLFSVEWVDKVTSFGFHDDVDGGKCPVTAHIRRANTRDMLDPLWDQPAKHRMGSALNNRRRILRRGLPYGGREDAQHEHGIVLLAYCASLFRQFEFVQQQWMNYGLDFNAGNDACPIVGTHAPGARFVIPAGASGGDTPFIASGLPQFVSTRGGDYFFQPSMTALRMIGQRLVDPT
jgi:Dyp-type peroxidase family